MNSEFDNPLTAVNNAHTRAVILERLEREHQDRVADCVRHWAQLRAELSEGERS